MGCCQQERFGRRQRCVGSEVRYIVNSGHTPRSAKSAHAHEVQRSGSRCTCYCQHKRCGVGLLSAREVWRQKGVGTWVRSIVIKRCSGCGLLSAKRSVGGGEGYPSGCREGCGGGRGRQMGTVYCQQEMCNKKLHFNKSSFF